MTSRDLVIRTLTHQPVPRAPRDLWVSPAVQAAQADEVAELRRRYPNDLVAPDFKYPRGSRGRGTPGEAGPWTDAWGCVWQVAQAGGGEQLAEAPLALAAEVRGYRPPFEILDRAGLGAINRGCAATPRFVLARSQARPFQRLQALRGTEAALVDLVRDSRSLRTLLPMLHEFFCRDLELWAASDVDGVVFGDPWGAQQGLLVAPETWRRVFKPLYRRYCEILRAADKFAFFHSDGDVAEILDDLVEIGVDAVHCQLFAMNIESLAATFRNRITFWGEIDRQKVLPLGTRADVAEAVRRVRAALDFGRGGVIAQCQWDPGIPFGNIAAVFESWLAPLPMKV